MDFLTLKKGAMAFKKPENISESIWRRKAKWIGHSLRRNCLLKYVIEGKVDGTRGRRRSLKQPPDDQEKLRYWILKWKD
jgi:hypothetical protein